MGYLLSSRSFFFIIICSLILGSGYGQAFFFQDHALNQTNSYSRLGDSTYLWEDLFFDENKIDSALSYNYSIDTSIGRVAMKHTYPAWAAYPDWQRLKPIRITNLEGSTLTQYIIDITVAYDTDMQPDFDDLRFADGNAYPLMHWIATRNIGQSARVYVRIPQLLSGNTTIYMFYGNQSASDASNTSLFSWVETTGEDLRVSYTLNTEGAWDPHVANSASQFLISWEEGEPPEYMPDQSHRLIRRHIHGRLLDQNGSNPIPPYPNDITISDSASTYHAENPSCAYSDDSEKYFVVYEENPTLNRWRVFIKGALMETDGFVYTPFTISNPSQGGIQYYPCLDPCVAYDTNSDRFFVVYSKSDTIWNYNVFGKLYDSEGWQVGSQITIANTNNYEGQAWVTSDNQGHFFVVYEEGPSSINGPFSLKAKLYDSNGIQIGSTISVATGTSSQDHIFPAVSYNADNEQYCVSWNTGDSSSGDYNGDIKAKIYDDAGSLEYTLTVHAGAVYKISCSIPYLKKLFFVSYDDDYYDLNSIQGRVVTSEGSVVASSQELSDSLYGFEKEMANLAVINKNILVAWEDDRLTLNVPPTEIRASVWKCMQDMGRSTVSVTIGGEKTRVLEAVVTSIVITHEDLVEWNEFLANVTYAQNTVLSFDILDASGGSVLISGISPGESLESITENAIRLRASFSRLVPTNTSYLDSWGVIATVGSDIEAPTTVATFTPDGPNGENGWYTTSIDILLEAYDNDSPPENITTYYRINQGSIQIYAPGSIIVFDVEGNNNTFEYWSEDNAGNEEEPHNIVTNLKIDYTPPFVTIKKPADIVLPGIIEINGSATEYASGSGIVYLSIRINDETEYESEYNTYFAWFNWEFTATYNESYDIHVRVIDSAGNIGQDRRQVVCTERGIYQPGYLYLFDNPKIGPLNLLMTLNIAMTIDQDTLFVVLPTVHENASSVTFKARKLITGQEFEFIDDDLFDGAIYDLPITSGLYAITAIAYDYHGVVLEEYVVISKMLVFLL